jgi:phospholipid/cholesterol/gamma-HCH transport system substrate-binding protein
MSAMSTHFKLGLFTVLALVGVVATAFGLGIRGVKSDTVNYHTYFDETVQGLDVGAPVKFRGVLIGSASQIQIAPDRRFVDVTLAINRPEAERLHLAERKPELRAQLSTQGITGVKLIDLDFFDPATYPPPKLSFPPAENYIPATPSPLTGLLNDLSVVGQRLPALIDATQAALHKIELLLDDLRGARIPDRLAKVLDTFNGSAVELTVLLRQVDRARIPDKAATAMDSLSGALARVNGLLENIGGDGGLVASTQRATDSIGDLGRKTAGGAADLDQTLRDLDDAALAIRDLAEAIDRDPDILVKGRARGKTP